MLSLSVGHITRDSYDDLRSEIFEQVVGRRPQPNFPALDDALIRTISFWKRALAAELGGTSNTELSRLFNAIIFARALEDQRRREKPNARRALLEEFTRTRGAASVRDIIGRTLRQFVDTVPPFLFDKDALAPFDTLDADTVRLLLLQFYDNQYAPYPYDFSVISKHALSRIYEHYVSLLRHEPDDQLSFLPQMPSEYSDRSQGAVLYATVHRALFCPLSSRSYNSVSVQTPRKSSTPRVGREFSCGRFSNFSAIPPRTDLTPKWLTKHLRELRASIVIPMLSRPRNCLSRYCIWSLQTSYRTPCRWRSGISWARANPINSLDAAFANPPFVPTDKQDESLRELLGSVVGARW